ncbi:MAG: hypothetical protein EA398_12750 [Deltaproteobacteria bacterium]|nr:MAG: hypothetical protein EA398_12750 [Deltaproteobacteria bacterium]
MIHPRSSPATRLPLFASLLVAAFFAGPGCSSTPTGTLGGGSGSDEQLESGPLRIDEGRFLAWRDDDTLRVDFSVTNDASRTREGLLTLSVLGPDGETLATGGAAVTAAPGETRLEVSLPAFDALPTGIGNAGVLGAHRLRWQVESGEDRLQGRVSLYRIWRKADLTLFNAGDVPLGGRTAIRLLARDPHTGAPVADAPVTIRLRHPGGTIVDLSTGRTDAVGAFSLPLTAVVGEEGLIPRAGVVGEEGLKSGDDPDVLLGDWLVIAEVEVEGTVHAMESPFRVSRDQRVMLTTDKPVYQPGQRIHLRALALSRPLLRPAAGRSLVFEAEDARGNRVFRQETETNQFGAGWMELPLASELNEGTWTLRAIVDGEATERTVRVERYQLPRFRVSLRPDREFYGPGDTAVLDIDAQYFFGQPVEGGIAVVQPWAFDVGFTPLDPVETVLDADGLGRVEIEVPRFLVGQELNEGNAFLRVDVEVTDRTEHTETLTRNLVVSEHAVLQQLIPATTVLGGQDNLVYLLTRRPDGRPVAASSTVRFAGDEVDVETDTMGFAELLLPAEAFTGDITVHSTVGNATAQRTFRLSGADEGTPEFAVLTDQALYRVGDRVEVDVRTIRQITGRAFIDVLREGQLVLQDAFDVVDGAGGFGFDLSDDFTGPLRLDIYTVTDDARIVRGQRLLYVEGASDLRLEWDSDRDEYRPGEEAEVTVRVTDAKGTPVVAALGLNIVDEAVFALQDMRPGLERVYFELEEALLQPQYTLYGWSFERVLAAGEVEDRERQTMASVVMAATDPPIAGEVVQPLPAADAAALASSRALAQSAFDTAVERLRERVEASVDNAWELESDPERLEILIGLTRFDADPWGRALEVTVEGDNTWVRGVRLVSAGIDESFGTAWDLERRVDLWSLAPNRGWPEEDFAGGEPVDTGADPAPSPPGGGGGDDRGDAPRVRSFFPETLLVRPDLITDNDGRAQLTVPLADNITTWRMTGMASSLDGMLGSGTAGLRVFQPFFVDIQFPLTLTMNDRVQVPVALFNYLETAQTVELRVDETASGDWYTLHGPSTLRVDLEPGEVTVRTFDVQVERPGRHAFQVTALGSEMSDAVRRVVDVVPDGLLVEPTVSDRIGESVSRTIHVPEEAIADASQLFVKIYPGLFAQVVEGLESLLRVPSGCFEQTSSVSYPNLLVLRYLQETGTGTPELELRATELLAQGYQRLVSYEVPGGGFEWFGNDPAHRILSAYGLLQFHDMRAVFPVDEAVITRTQAWLASQQEGDGRWRAAPEGIHEGATNSFRDSDARATAYIAYAMAESGETTASTRALAWLRGQVGSLDDAYSLAMAANAFLAADTADATGHSLLERLEAMKESEEADTGVRYFWDSDSQSLYYSGGNAMRMEVTALALQAYVRAGFAPQTVEGGINFLLANKDSFGNWSSTQATILTLRLFIEQLLRSTGDAEGTLRVYHEDTLVETFQVDASNADLMRQVDLTDRVLTGDNDITLTFEGEGDLLFQIVGRYWIPWDLADSTPPESPLTIDVEYDRTRLEVDEQVTVTVTVHNRSVDRQDMIMLDLGIPPGFDVLTGDFRPLIDDPSIPITRTERRGRQLTVYVYGLDPGSTLTFDYRMQATLAVRATAPSSAVWLYYQPDARAEAVPVEFDVQ